LWDLGLDSTEFYGGAGIDSIRSGNVSGEQSCFGKIDHEMTRVFRGEGGVNTGLWDRKEGAGDLYAKDAGMCGYCLVCWANQFVCKTFMGWFDENFIEQYDGNGIKVGRNDTLFWICAMLNPFWTDGVVLKDSCSIGF